MSIVKLNNQAVKNATSFGSISSLGSMTLIKKLTASSSATLSFVDGSSGVVLDNTYKEYLFTLNNIHPQNDDTHLYFNMSIDGGSNYNVAKTTTVFRTYHDEGDSVTLLDYRTGPDLAQGTGFQLIANGVGNLNDESSSGYLHLFNPSSTTFVKHFISKQTADHESSGVMNHYVAGYGNTTSSVDAVIFQMSSDNIDAGDICLYGIA